MSPLRSQIFGTETEYGVYNNVKEVALSSFLNINFLRKVGHFPAHLGFMFNGGRFYVDVPTDIGGVPEFATPEVRSVRDLVCWEKAGELLINQIFALEDGNAEELMIVKHSRGAGYGDTESEVSAGHHENYSVPLSPDRFKMTFEENSLSGPCLATFLVSRVILNGSGWFSSNEPDAYYEISSRAKFIEQMYGSVTTNQRPIIHSGRESHAPKSMKRMHLIMGDHNMCEPALYLTIGTTALVLRMLVESDLLRNSPVLSRPVDALHIFSHGPYLKERALLLGTSRHFARESATALELQKYFCLKAEQFIAGSRFIVTDEERHIVSYWRDVLTRLGEDIFSLNGELDWVTKWVILKKYLQKHNVTSLHSAIGKKLVRIERAGRTEDLLVDRCRSLELAYHIITSQGIYNQLNRAGKVKRIVTDEEIQRALYHAPPFTRASIREDVLRWVVDRGLAIQSMDWTEITLKLNAKSFKVQLENPLDFTNQQWQNIKEAHG